MLTVCGPAELASHVTQFRCQSSIIQVVLTKHQIKLPHVWSSFPALLLHCTNLDFELEEMKKVDRVFCTPFVMKVEEKSGQMGNHTEGASKTVFVLICRRFNWRSSQMGPSPIVCPRITKWSDRGQRLISSIWLLQTVWPVEQSTSFWPVESSGWGVATNLWFTTLSQS